MKLNQRHFPKIYSQLGKDVGVLLVYGPDEGACAAILNQARTIALGPDADPMSFLDLGADALAKDPAQLYDEAAQISFFGGTKVVKAGPVADAHLPQIKAILDAELPSVVLLSAKNLTPRSKVRQLLEKAPRAGIFACYHDDDAALSRLIDEKLSTQNIGLSRDARAFLISQLGADRGVTLQELEKLALYAHTSGGEPASLELADVRALIGDNAEQRTTAIADHAFIGHGSRADAALLQAYAHAVDSIAVVRALSRRAMQLLGVKAAQANGQNLEAALKAARPPVFWKEKSAFEAQLRVWPLGRIEAVIGRIDAAEALLKSGAGQPQAITGRLILQIASAAQRASGR